MGRKRTTGLFKKRGIWQIDKQILGRRIRMSTGTADLNEAELVLARYVDNLRRSTVFGERQQRSFSEASARYLKEKTHKASLAEDKRAFAYLEKHIGHLALESVHMGSLQEFIHERQTQGVKNRPHHQCCIRSSTACFEFGCQ